MSITIRQRISFDIKAVVDEESRECFATRLLEVAKAHVSGIEPFDNRLKYLVSIALNEGEEAFIAACLKEAFIELIKEEIARDTELTVSNFSSRLLKVGK